MLTNAIEDKTEMISSIIFRELVAEMTREILDAAKRDELVNKHGYTVFNRNE